MVVHDRDQASPVFSGAQAGCRRNQLQAEETFCHRCALVSLASETARAAPVRPASISESLYTYGAGETNSLCAPTSDVVTLASVASPVL